jgi:hypothetical protein
MQTKSQALIFLWRYRENRRNYPGYHLTANREGCDQLLEILGAHEKAKQAIQTIVSLSSVTPQILSVPDNTRGDAACVSLAAWELITQPEFPPEYFQFQESYPICRLQLSQNQAGCIAEGVKDIQAGKGDYCIGGEGDQVLWFWWFEGT